MSGSGERVDGDILAAAKASYDRCCAIPDFFAAFYRNLFAAQPEVEAMFARTDLDTQQKLLKHGFGLLLIFPNQPDGEPTILTRIAERHSRRDLAVAPSLYPVFIDALIDTVRQYDSSFTPAVEEAWRRTVHKGVAYMQARY